MSCEGEAMSWGEISSTRHLGDVRGTTKLAAVQTRYLERVERGQGGYLQAGVQQFINWLCQAGLHSTLFALGTRQRERSSLRGPWQRVTLTEGIGPDS